MGMKASNTLNLLSSEGFYAYKSLLVDLTPYANLQFLA